MERRLCIRTLCLVMTYCCAVSFSLQLESLSPADPSSYSRPETPIKCGKVTSVEIKIKQLYGVDIDLAVLKNINLSWAVDFNEKILRGHAELSMQALQEVTEIILDASDLSISGIRSGDGSELTFELSEHRADIGSKLTVRLPAPAPPGTNLTLVVEYSTSPKARALQWLDAAQTSTKRHPYLFSQSSPIHARTIVPCQDTPAVKFTYSARVVAAAELTVLMSALREAPPAAGAATTFRQPVPIPAYLLAIAVGDLESKPLGPRSVVWSERAELEKSAWEFADTERYLQAAERLCGPYVWGEYNLLVLPPSFPYGGMENPCLTFVTPTLLAGDRSQADVIVHEIVHSWTGNLITHNNFEHFWLKEGFTVFLERKVVASLVEDAAAARRSRDFESILGLQGLKETISTLGADNPLTKLVVDLNGVHPDEAFSTVPYEKGSLFLRYLEDLVGGPEVFDEFLRSYLDHFKRRSLNTDEFKAYLLEYFSSRNSSALAAVDWQTWLYSPGMPPRIPDYDTTLANECRQLVARILAEPAAALSAADVASFSPHQTVQLLEELLEQEPLPADKLRAVGAAYALAGSRNAEVVFRYLRLSLRSRDERAADAALRFVNAQGRMKYVRPLYRELYAWQATRARAVDNFLAHEPAMMHVSAYTLRKDLHLDADNNESLISNNE